MSRPGFERRVLFVCYAFPPTGGGGVQRSVKFVKFLPQYGWLPTVLTAANPSVPIQDHDFDSDVNPALRVIRAQTWEPSYRVKKQVAYVASSRNIFKQTALAAIRRLGMHLLQPDPQILWNPQALRAAIGELNSQNYDAIYVTGPPFSSFLLGCKLKERFGIPLIVDFRDEWILASRYLENYQHAGRAARKQERMLASVLSSADAVIATTQASAEELRSRSRESKNSRSVSCIYNGFDADDIARALEQSQPSSPTQRFRIVYTGTLWRLTDIRAFVSGILLLVDTQPELAARIELVIAGRCSPDQAAVLDRLETTCIDLQRLGYLPHSQALELAKSADALLLLLADEPGAERVVPAKLFEYLALNRPILSVGPVGETSSLLRTYSLTETISVDRPADIARWLVEQLTDPNTDRHKKRENRNGRGVFEKFSREKLTGELASILDTCTSKRHAA